MGNLKGVGRIYQQTFVDTYSKVAHCKRYITKTPITAADLLNDRVLPFYESQGLPMLRILTDRGTEYCGKVEHHDYQLYLEINDIEQTESIEEDMRVAVPVFLRATSTNVEASLLGVATSSIMLNVLA